MHVVLETDRLELRGFTPTRAKVEYEITRGEWKARQYLTPRAARRQRSR